MPNQDALILVDELAYFLEEAHADEMNGRHGGESEEPGPDPINCSYCLAISQAHKFIEAAPCSARKSCLWRG